MAGATSPPRDLGLGRPTEAMTRRENAAAVNNIPMAIFRGAEGSFPFLLRYPNRATTTGVRATMKNGLKCWKRWGVNGLMS